jgi:hypothetical protein
MTSVNRHTSVDKDAQTLRDFIHGVFVIGATVESRVELLACIDRLEALATSTAKRSGVGSFIHIIKQRLQTDTHCGRPVDHVNFVTTVDSSDLSDPKLCKRCVQLYQNRQAKEAP